MAFNIYKAKNAKYDKDELELPQENMHLFDNFVKQFNSSIRKLNKSRKKFVRLKYYLMNEILVFEVLNDCEIPLINLEQSTYDKFYFENDLSFKIEKGCIFKMSLQKSDLFKYLIKNGLSYYKNRETKLEDLVERINYNKYEYYFDKENLGENDD